MYLGEVVILAGALGLLALVNLIAWLAGLRRDTTVDVDQMMAEQRAQAGEDGPRVVGRGIARLDLDRLGRAWFQEAREQDRQNEAELKAWMQAQREWYERFDSGF